MSSQNSKPIYDPAILNWWERHIVPKLIGCACSQPQIMKARSRIVGQSSGDVLELGCGGGINTAFLNPAQIKSYSGLDPSPGLLDATNKAVQKFGVQAEIRAGIGEAMPFEDARFDTVLVTFTLCSVQDQAQVLAEMRRVLRPGGKILFLEHGRAPDPDVQKWQRRIEPIWKRIGGGCHLTRSIEKAYVEAGFKIMQCEKSYMPKTPRPFGWIEWGEARV
jgi:ubiquinone/menaquinone biosynthesis C-methylase UbiE